MYRRLNETNQQFHKNINIKFCLHHNVLKVFLKYQRQSNKFKLLKKDITF